MHPCRLPRNNYPSCKNDFLVTEEGEAPFDSEVVQQPLRPPLAQEQAVEATMTAEKNT